MLPTEMIRLQLVVPAPLRSQARSLHRRPSVAGGVTTPRATRRRRSLSATVYACSFSWVHVSVRIASLSFLAVLMLVLPASRHRLSLPDRAAVQESGPVCPRLSQGRRIPGAARRGERAPGRGRLRSSFAREPRSRECFCPSGPFCGDQKLNLLLDR